MPRKTVILLSCVAAAALTFPVNAQVADGTPYVYGDYNAATTVDAGFATVEEEAAAIRIYQQSLNAPAQTSVQTSVQEHQYPMAKTYSSREDALAGIQVEIFDTPIPQNSMAAHNVTYGTAHTQTAATTPVQTPSYTYSAPVTTTATTSASSFSSVSSYTVSQGDTLYAISGRYGIKVPELMNANGLSSSNISIGQVLSIPSANFAPIVDYVEAPVYTQSVTSASSYSYPEATIVRNDLPQSYGQTYGVLPGDTLSSIARRHCVTASAIALASGINTADTLMPGDMLTVPAGNCG